MGCPSLIRLLAGQSVTVSACGGWPAGQRREMLSTNNGYSHTLGVISALEKIEFLTGSNINYWSWQLLVRMDRIWLVDEPAIQRSRCAGLDVVSNSFTAFSVFFFFLPGRCVTIFFPLWLFFYSLDWSMAVSSSVLGFFIFLLAALCPLASHRSSGWLDASTLSVRSTLLSPIWLDSQQLPSYDS